MPGRRSSSKPANVAKLFAMYDNPPHAFVETSMYSSNEQTNGIDTGSATNKFKIQKKSIYFQIKT